MAEPLSLEPEGIARERPTLGTFLQSLRTQYPGHSTTGLTSNEVQEAIKALPRLTEKQVIELGHKDSSCPICLETFLSLLSQEETALAMDSPAFPVEDLGVTQLEQTWQCKHIFCRKDISKWIREGHDSCPMCRHRLLERDDSDPSNNDYAAAERALSGYLAMERLLSFSMADLEQDRSAMPADEEADTDRERGESSGMYS